LRVQVCVRELYYIFFVLYLTTGPSLVPNGCPLAIVLVAVCCG